MKLKSIVLLSLFLSITSLLNAQKYLTQSGTITFFSETPMENIDAVNNQVSSVLNAENGELAFSLLMKAFVFEKALMQEHFNEKYVESPKFPKSTFKGTISSFDLSKLSDSSTEFPVKGKLTIHGVTKEVSAVMKISKSGEKINANSKFTINLDDFDIKIPAAVKDNISKTIDIKVKLDYEKVG